MELSISEAGKLLKVHRSTLHEWLDKGYIQKNEKNGLVDTAQIVERLQIRGRTNGRVAGWAYDNVELSRNADLGITLERGVVMLSEVFRTLSPRQQVWIRRAIFDKIGDPRLLEQEVVPMGGFQKKPRENRQERAWNDAMVRGTLNPKVKVSSKPIRDWARKLKRIMLSQEANLEVSEEQIKELDSIIEPAKTTELK